MTAGIATIQRARIEPAILVVTALLLILVVFGSVFTERFGTSANMRNVLEQSAALGFVALSVGLTVSWFTQGLRLPTHAELVRLMAVVLALVLGAVAALRHRVLANTYSRRMTGLIVLQTVVFLAHRVMGAARALPPADILVDELLIAGTFPAVAAVAGYRELAPGAVFSFAGALACVALPQHVALVHPIALLGAQVSYLGVGYQHHQQPDG